MLPISMARKWIWRTASDLQAVSTCCCVFTALCNAALHTDNNYISIDLECTSLIHVNSKQMLLLMDSIMKSTYITVPEGLDR